MAISTPVAGRQIAIQNGELILFSDIFSRHESLMLFECLIRETNWQQPELTIAGKQIKIPRLQAWYGDTDARYRYSGLIMEPEPWTELLTGVRQRVEEVSGCHFNAVLINRYRDGNDSVGWHSDDEPELGRNPSIASLSLGENRVFHLQHKKHKEIRLKLELEHGSLLLMKGELQHYWRHQLPKSKRSLGERINLTFRKIYS